MDGIKKEEFAKLFFSAKKYEGALEKKGEFYIIDDVLEGKVKMPVLGCAIKEISREQFLIDKDRILNYGKPDMQTVNRLVCEAKELRKKEKAVREEKFPGKSNAQIFEIEELERQKQHRANSREAKK